MKIVNAGESKSLIVGASDTHTMTTGDTSLIFHLLSENLYSDGVLASFREIITNAWDSHIVSGCTDIPVKITIKDNTCTIKDSGSGIPHDLFKSLYGTLGGTSKDGCNNTTGGMGIGKLAPLTVCDNFIVINKHGGEAVTYSINKGSVQSQGVHTIDTLVQYPTESTGLTVIFTVNADIDLHINNIFHFLVTSDIRSSFFVETPEHSHTCELEPLVTDYPFYFIPHYTPQFGSRPSAYVRWGNNTYDASPYLKGEHTTLLRELIECNRISVIFKIPYDSYLNITPNREHLIKSDHNKEVIKGVLKEIEKDIKKKHESFVYNSIKSRRKNLIRSYDLNNRISKSVVRNFDFVDDCFNLKTMSFEESLNTLSVDVPHLTYMSKILPGGLGLQLKRTYNSKNGKVDITKTKKYRKLVSLFHEYNLKPHTRVYISGYSNHDSTYSKILLASKIKIGRTNHSSTDFTIDCVGIKLGVRQDQSSFVKKLQTILQCVDISYLEDIPTKKKTPTSSKKRKSVRKFISLTNYINEDLTEEHKKWTRYVPSSIADLLKIVLQTKSKVNKGVVEFLEENGGTDNIVVSCDSFDFQALEKRKILRLYDTKLLQIMVGEVEIKPKVLSIIHVLHRTLQTGLPEISNRKNNYFRVILEILEGDNNYKKFTKNELIVLNWLVSSSALSIRMNQYGHSKYEHFYSIYDYIKSVVVLNNTPALQTLKQSIIDQESITHEN